MYSHFILVLEKYPLANPAVDPGFYNSYLPLSSIILPSLITESDPLDLDPASIVLLVADDPTEYGTGGWLQNHR